MLGNKRARCCYQKSHIWLASHRFPTPALKGLTYICFSVPDYEKCGGNGWISDPSSDRCYKVGVGGSHKKKKHKPDF